MSDVRFRKGVGCYDLIWDDEKVAMRFERLRETRGHLHARITVQSLLPGQGHHLVRDEYDLESRSHKNNLE